MKDKASADTQRTEAVNCTVEITGGEKTDRERESERDRERERVGVVGGGGMGKKGEDEERREQNEWRKMFGADKNWGENEKKGETSGLCHTE